MKKKIIISILLVFIILIIGILVFFPFDAVIKEKIEKSLGSNVSIKKLKIKWNNIYAEDILIKKDSGEEFLTVKELKIKLYFLALLKKQFEIKEIQMDSPSLFLNRNKKGEWQIPSIKEGSKKEPLYLVIKESKLIDGTVTIQDELKGFYIKLTNVHITMKSNISLFKSGNTVITGFAKCTEGGDIMLKSVGNFTDEQFNGTLSIKDLNIRVLKPYIKGDLTVKKGFISLDSEFSINKGYVKAPSILKAKGVEIESKGFLMGISAPLLIELLKKKEEIVLPFNIWGRWDNLQNDLENVIKKRVSEEVGKTVTSPLKTITKPLTDIFKN